MKNSTAVSAHKIFLLILAVTLLLILGPSISYIKTAFGWTNPTGAPPSGSGALYADPSNGNVGINTVNASATLTVNGTISAVGNWIKDVRTPSASMDAVNKAYVDAQTGGGGAVVTLFGISNANITPGAAQKVSQGQANCFVGTSGLLCNSLPGNYGITPGTGVSACSTIGDGSWQQLYAGYGPHGNIISWFSNVGTTDPEESDWPQSIAAATYSTCALVPDQLIGARYSTQNGQVHINMSALSACLQNKDGIASCNTCRVCYKP